MRAALWHMATAGNFVTTLSHSCSCGCCAEHSYSLCAQFLVLPLLHCCDVATGYIKSHLLSFRHGWIASFLEKYSPLLNNKTQTQHLILFIQVKKERKKKSALHENCLRKKNRIVFRLMGICQCLWHHWAQWMYTVIIIIIIKWPLPPHYLHATSEVHFSPADAGCAGRWGGRLGAGQCSEWQAGVRHGSTCWPASELPDASSCSASGSQSSVPGNPPAETRTQQMPESRQKYT